MGLYDKYIRKKTYVPKSTIVDTELNKDFLDTVVAYNKYGTYCLPVSAQYRTLGQKILRGDVFEPDTIEFIRSNSAGGDVIHAGTFFGDFLPGLSGGMADGAIIWAFEPCLENFKCAQVTLILNNLQNVNLMNFGLGQSGSTEYLNTVDKKGKVLGGSSSIGSGPGSKGIWEEISIVAIDEMIPEDRNISILQLDVEGFEEQALKGALKTIERCRPILILEDDHKVTQSEWFQSNILTMGYRIDGKLHYNTIVRPVS